LQSDRHFTGLEKRIDEAAHRLLDNLPRHKITVALIEFLVFGLKQAWACLFGGAMLGLIIMTRWFWPDGGAGFITRYDFLFLSALAIQLAMLVFKLEAWEEAKVILIFHVVGTAMEIFKTHAGSWVYPEENFFRIGGVPLFSGFMYAAVGSYMARINRSFRYKAEPLSAALDDRASGRRDLCQFLRAPLHLGCALAALCCYLRALLAHDHALPRLSLPA
jgi:hypothetical protein